LGICLAIISLPMLNSNQSKDGRIMTFTNGTMMQYFHWYNSNDGGHWRQITKDAAELAAAGFTALWLPPVYKGSNGINEVGYSTYDLFDLGEFDQKGSVRTKYGTKAELEVAIKTAQSAGIQIYLDTVFNHKNGGDAKESIDAIPVSMENRNQDVDGVKIIEAWTRFDFGGRGDKYSAMKWNWRHFDSVNYNALAPNENTIYRFKAKNFETGVNMAHGNYDFLMACDLDTSEPEVVAELQHWGEWIVATLGVDGFRLDAVKHVRSSFFSEWLSHLRKTTGKELFTVGEYWSNDLGELQHFIDSTGGQLSLFDVPLHYNLAEASKAGGNYNMCRIFDGTLVQRSPNLAVTFVENHDSQPLQALESLVEGWFKPLAYALILLRSGGYPCVFYADYYGASYQDRGRDGHEYQIVMDAHRQVLDHLLAARRDFAYGEQIDYFDHPNVVGWSRGGDQEHPGTMAVLLSDGPAGSKWMNVGKANQAFCDLTGHCPDVITTNGDGWGEFRCNGGSVSVWIEG
jgi:alpha-amylase